jgi:hypothetical protein
MTSAAACNAVVAQSAARRRRGKLAGIVAIASCFAAYYGKRKENVLLF